MQTSKQTGDTPLSHNIEYNKRIIDCKSNEVRQRAKALFSNQFHRTKVMKHSNKQIEIQQALEESALLDSRSKSILEQPNYSRSPHHYVSVFIPLLMTKCLVCYNEL